MWTIMFRNDLQKLIFARRPFAISDRKLKSRAKLKAALFDDLKPQLTVRSS